MTARELGAEFLGTAGLLLAIVGSGIASGSADDAATQLFQHAVVVGAVLGALIATFASVSGAHFNPAVTLVGALFGGLRRRTAAAYLGAQLMGGIGGVVLAHLLFALPPVAVSGTDRTGLAMAASETVATFGLVMVIFGVLRSGRPGAVPAATGAWIAGAIYFTSSTSFANPAVTVARLLTDTFTGIAPGSVPAFLAAQLLGAVAAAATIRWLLPASPDAAAEGATPHDREELP